MGMNTIDAEDKHPKFFVLAYLNASGEKQHELREHFAQCAECQANLTQWFERYREGLPQPNWIELPSGIQTSDEFLDKLNQAWRQYKERLEYFEVALIELLNTQRGQDIFFCALDTLRSLLQNSYAIPQDEAERLYRVVDDLAEILGEQGIRILLGTNSETLKQWVAKQVLGTESGEPFMELTTDEPPQEAYPFGRFAKLSLHEWEKPVLFSQDPLRVVQILVRWEVQAGYIAYTDFMRALYGLARRNLLHLQAYWEKPFSDLRALAGYKVIPQRASLKGDAIILWAPAYQEPGDQKPPTTGFLRLTAEPQLDFQLLMNTFIADDPQGDLLNVFMDNGDHRGYPPTSEEERGIESILKKAQK